MVKLIDFGLAHRGDPSKIPKANVLAGTPVYLPPEVLKEAFVSSSLDVYSFGIILWEMMTRRLPFDGLDLKSMIYEVTRNDLRPQFPSTADPQLVDIASKCWESDASLRPNFEEISLWLQEAGAPAVPLAQKAQFETIQAM
eukprot:CAMPEP_0184306328 /NCGR_PEP_ID=MMETSP1049-20130417/15351_1 /TAXON_ID=77928 /ORGANISM="Proteomonas sulcata, Strain CCMP704" /LENGTH=140 /DNA_ID=CAMNT_0026618563 /DNA_START=285 /DNA_END=707 /DNA_ORIENTATION=-